MAEDQRAGRSSVCCSFSRSSRRSQRSLCSNPCSTIRPGTSPAAGRTTRSTWAPSSTFSSSSRTSARRLFCIRLRGGRTSISLIGYVGARIIESVSIATGIIFILGVVSLRSDASRRGRPRRLARPVERLDFPAWPRNGGAVRERSDSRLPDVQVRSRPAADGLARNDRRPAAPDREHRGAVRRVGSDGACEPSGCPGIHLGGVPRDLLRNLGVQRRPPDPRARRPVELADHRNARTAARGCAALLAAPVGPVWGCVRRALGDRLVRERRGCARLRRFGSSLDELGGRQPVAEPHRRVIDAARRVRVPLLPIDDAQRARRGRIVDLGPSTTRSRRVRRRPDRDGGNDDGDRHHQLGHLRRGRRRSCGQSGGRDQPRPGRSWFPRWGSRRC